METVQALFVVLGYLMGSFPSAFIAGKVFGKVDIRTVDNQIAGASNVFRHVSKTVGVVVGVVDIAKGALAVVIADQLGTSPMIAALTGLAAIVGHSWPVWTGFHGGLGAASGIGVTLALLSRPTILVAPLALIVLFVVRQPSPAATTVLAGAPLVGALLGADPWKIGVGLVIAVLVFVRAITWKVPDGPEVATT